MPDQPGVGLLVIGLDPERFKQVTGAGSKIIHPLRLQLAVPAGDNAVAATGIESGHDMPVGIPSHRQLYLVAVSFRVGGRHHRLYRHIQPSQPGKGILHKGGFGVTFCGILHVPQPAAAAGAKGRAVRCNPSGSWHQNFLDASKDIPAEHLDNPHLQPVAGSRTGDKDCHPVGPADAVSVAGQRQNFQFQNLILFQRHSFLRPERIPGKIGGPAGSFRRSDPQNPMFSDTAYSCGFFSKAVRYRLGGTPLTFLNTREK